MSKSLHAMVKVNLDDLGHGWNGLALSNRKGKLMNLKALLCAAILFSLRAYCSTNITLVVGGTVSNASLTVSAGQVAKVVSGNLVASATLRVEFSGASVSYSYNSSLGTITPTPLPMLAGPATISLMGFPSAGGGFTGAFCTVELSDNGGSSFLPSNAVVIPADSGGPVNIILESSADLVTWSAALPGIYGASTTNRFFRVRAVRAP
jgi:hypothetical protein